MNTDDALTAARKVAGLLHGDAAERDRAGRRPVREVRALRESGLLGLAPDDHVTTHAVVRIVAAADASIGHLLGYHYLHLWRIGLFDRPEQARRIWRDTAERNWFWAAATNPQDTIRATPSPDGLVVNGSRAFATGAAVADRLVVNATRDDGGDRLTIVMDARLPGIGHPDDWDNMGQRLSASGSVTFDGVRVPHEQVVGALPAGRDDPRMVRLSLSALAYQSVLTQVLVAIAEGALAEAARYTREHARPWPLGGAESAGRDPYILAGYGELVASVRAAGLLADQAASALRAASDLGPALTAEVRGETGVTISSAKVVATRVVLETTTRIFDFIGARGTAGRFGFDRFWRDARTLTLHDPVVYKAREVGAHFLTGELPPPTAYS
ncbi:monooxygenase [Sphaerisporangium melleum]|uniref:Monooxygenase n=1 Tax=Sphaerisporangium melleum TaxID=321316 RepID=A0A917VFY6_9ACTN|nr:acyl-CoA dehydrogenase family protein [Sphaerisporangium melleum]GGK74670.1 monooxygenase [Sphaerisporangium melleum]GII70945.1 monooxygenase [Sphaerisporangium melleum]